MDARNVDVTAAPGKRRPTSTRAIAPPAPPLTDSALRSEHLRHGSRGSQGNRVSRHGSGEELNRVRVEPEPRRAGAAVRDILGTQERVRRQGVSHTAVVPSVGAVAEQRLEGLAHARAVADGCDARAGRGSAACKRAGGLESVERRQRTRGGATTKGKRDEVVADLQASWGGERLQAGQGAPGSLTSTRGWSNVEAHGCECSWSATS